MQFVSSVFAFTEGETMEGNGKLITIREASQLTGKSEGLIYRYIRQGKITVQTCSVHCSGKFRQVKKLKEAEVLRSFGLNFEPETEQSRTYLNQSLNKAEPLTMGSLKEVIETYFQDRETQLIKPLEELATYRVGKLENELQHIKAEKETLRRENEELREQIKSLPDRQEVESREKKILEQSENIRILQKEKEVIMSLREQADNEKMKLEELQEGQKAELETLKEEEKNYLATIEELKRRLEAEEKRPWWRKIF